MLLLPLQYWVMAINVSRIWIEWAEWAALRCTANSPFPGHVYCRQPVQHSDILCLEYFFQTSALTIYLYTSDNVYVTCLIIRVAPPGMGPLRLSV